MNVSKKAVREYKRPIKKIQGSALVKAHLTSCVSAMTYPSAVSFRIAGFIPFG